jgi:hypothetical protein
MENKEAKNVQNQLSDKDIEDIRNAYQSLPQMIAFEGQKPWNALSVFIQLAFVLAAGAIVPTFLPETNDILGAAVGIFLSIAGVIATFVWLSFDRRYRMITRYWVLSMRDLEDQLSGRVQAFQRGRDFAEGKSVTVSREKISYKGIEAKLSVRKGFLIIYCVFLIVFLFLFGLNGYRLVEALVNSSVG